MADDIKTNGSIYVCIKQFNARLGDELSLMVGDKVEVLADDSEYNDGWYMGKNLLTNEVGLYPKSFTQLLQSQSPENLLLRSRSRRVSNRQNNVVPQTPVNNINKISDSIDKLNINKDSASKQVNKTMSDIDKALSELRSESLSVTQLEAQNRANDEHSRKPSKQSLTEDLNPFEARNWTPQQVSSYFAIVLGFDLDIAGKFARHKITGAILFELDLTHLKELDIDSFGTRFEIYKEIEKLKQKPSGPKYNNKVTTNKSSSVESDGTEDEFVSPPGSKTTSPYKYNTFPNNSDEDSSFNTSSNSNSYQSPFSRSQNQLLPSASLNSSLKNEVYPKGHQRKTSQSMDNLSSADEKKKSFSGSPELAFVSPRKAPQPPKSSPLNKNFRFGSSSISNDNNGYNELYMTRTNTSNASLGISQVNETSRPASSVYEPISISHSRNASQTSNNKDLQYRRNSAVVAGHRGHSSLFSFLSGNNEDNEKSTRGKHLSGNSNYGDIENIPFDSKQKLTSPAKVKREASIVSPRSNDGNLTDLSPNEEVGEINNSNFSPKKSKSLSYKSDVSKAPVSPISKEQKRSPSESSAVSRLKNLRTTSTQNFRSLTTSKKSKTSAFQEGIKEVTPDEAIKTANYSGWMSKKSSNTLGWRSRYFTLHGTRLSYFTSLRDKREKGLIDITAHKVMPVSTDSDTNSNDKYIALYASSAGLGRYCFKLLPPAPGFKKGLTFTQPKTHYFAVETQEEMRGWLKAIMTATIDIDDSVPVVSSCSTPTVSLSKAQELLAKAREETKLKDEELRAKGYIRDGYEDGYQYSQFLNESNDGQTSVGSTASPNIDSLDETTISSHNQQPKLAVDTSIKNYRAPSTPQISAQSGFASPYLLASGLLSPKSGNSNGTSSPSDTPNSNSRSNLDYFNESNSTNTESTPKSVFSNSIGRITSGSKKKHSSEKMLAYSNDGSGNHTFVIKSKKQ